MKNIFRNAFFGNSFRNKNRHSTQTPDTTSNTPDSTSTNINPRRYNSVATNLVSPHPTNSNETTDHVSASRYSPSFDFTGQFNNQVNPPRNGKTNNFRGDINGTKPQNTALNTSNLETSIGQRNSQPFKNSQNSLENNSVSNMARQKYGDFNNDRQNFSRFAQTSVMATKDPLQVFPENPVAEFDGSATYLDGGVASANDSTGIVASGKNQADSDIEAYNSIYEFLPRVH
jgi:hypothetical protein